MEFSLKSISISMAVLSLFIFTFWGYPLLVNYLQPKACVENGGKWNAAELVCENEPN